jgi:hypothetical protein
MRGHINIEPTETTSGDGNALNLAIIRDDGRVIKDTGTIEAATNTGSLLLWGSSAYPRMDRADTVSTGALPDARRMLCIGFTNGPIGQNSRVIADGINPFVAR